MKKFEQTTLSDGTLTARGPFQVDPGTEVKHLHFLVAQAGVLVEGEAFVSGDEWSGRAPAGDLQPGPAHGQGLAIMLSSGSPPALETFTWLEPIDVSG